MISRLAAHVVVFLYVYSLQLVVSPAGLGTRAWFGCIGFLYFFYKVMTDAEHKRIDPDISRAVMILLSLALLSLVTIVINSTTDLVFLIYVPSMLAVAFAAYFVAQVVRRAYPENSGTAAKNIFINIVFIQICIAFFMFLWPDLANKLNSLLVTSDLDKDLLVETGEFRLSGFGARFFGAGIVNCYALILIAALIRSIELSGVRLFYLAAAFLLIAFLGMMMSRTTLIGAGLAVAFLMLPYSVKEPLCHRFVQQRRAFWLSLSLIFIVLTGAALTFFSNLAESIAPAMQFGFELFINYFQSGRLESESTTQLLDMYSLDSDLPLIVGDGHYADPQDPGQYYKAVDVGYMRLIYYFGLPGLATYMAFQYRTIRMSSRHMGLGEGPKFFVVSLMLVLLLNFKGFTDIFVFSIYIYACVMGRDAFFKNSAEIPLHQQSLNSKVMDS